MKETADASPTATKQDDYGWKLFNKVSNEGLPKPPVVVN